MCIRMIILPMKMTNTITSMSIKKIFVNGVVFKSKTQKNQRKSADFFILFCRSFFINAIR
jgi:hypothetical protein